MCAPSHGISKTLPFIGEKETYRSISRSFRSTSPRFLFPVLSVSFRRVGGGRWNRNISARRTRICCVWWDDDDVFKKKQHVWWVSSREMFQRTCDGFLMQKNKGKRFKKNEARTLDPFKNQFVRVLLLFWQRSSRLLERGLEEEDVLMMKILMWRNLSQRLGLFSLHSSQWWRSKAKGKF